MSEIDPQNPGPHPNQKESGHPLVNYLLKVFFLKKKLPEIENFRQIIIFLQKSFVP